MYKITAVIVTYGNRGDLLKKSISSISGEISRIIIVNNAGFVPDFIREGKDNTVIDLPKNLGPASAIAIGLDRIRLHTDIDYVLLIDDDMQNSGISLRDACEILGNSDEYRKSILVPYRENFLQKKKARDYRDENTADVIGVRDEFNGFSLFKKPPEIVNKNKKNIAFLNACPYGGMLIPFGLLQKFPNPPDFTFLYTDDFLWTHLMWQEGVKIVQYKSYKFIDMDGDYHKESSVLKKGLASLEGVKLFFMVRNLLFFEIDFLKKRSIKFYLNAAAYMGITYFQLVMNLRFRDAGNLTKAIIKYFRDRKISQSRLSKFKEKFKSEHSNFSG